MFLAPSSCRAVDPYLQTSLLRVSLSTLGGKLRHFVFLVPSSSRAVDPYLQTLLLMVSLSRLGGKHRQLACQVGDSTSSSAKSMAGSSDANNVPKGTTLVFGSWACMADGSGGFSSHLVMPNSPKLKTTVQLTDIRKPADLDEKRVLP